MNAPNFETGKNQISEFKLGPATIVIQRSQGGAFTLCSIRTKAKAQHSGCGELALTALTIWADRTKTDIELLASPLTRKTRLGSLVNWYRRHGFVITGRYNAAGDPFMRRKFEHALDTSI